MSKLQVYISDNQSTPYPVAHLSDVVEGLRFSRQLDGGELSCSFIVREPTQFVPTWIGPNFDVRIVSEDGQHAWRGRMEEAYAVENENEEYWEITAVGYAANLDDRIDTSENVSGLATDVIVTNFLTNHTQQIDVQSVSATGVTLSAATAITLTNEKGYGHVNFAKRFGFSDDMPAQWYVKTQADGDREFLFEKRPTAASYFIYRRDWTNARRGFTFKEYANRVVVEYNSGASVVTVDDTTAQGAGPAGVGVIRTAFISIPEITQAADATQAGEALLTKLKTLRMNARSISIRPNAIILDDQGLEVKPYMVQIGKIMQVVDVVSGAAAMNTLAWNNSFVIVGMEWDDDTQTLNLTPESFDSSMSMVIAKARKGTE